MELESKIGFMQGRLIKSINNNIQCFPKDCWEDEFPIAEKLGFKKIEWIFDSLDNPILDSQQHLKIKSLCEKHHVSINSICADFFMTHKLFSESENEISKNLLVLENLIDNSSLFGINIIEIPLVDSSSLKSDSDIEEFSKNDILFDIGANVGVYSLYASKKIDLVYAFEPHHHINVFFAA